MSYLQAKVADIQPLQKNEEVLQSALIQIEVTGELHGKNSPFTDACFAEIKFDKPFSQKPSAAFIGNFIGSDFAELIWSITNLNEEGFILFVTNQSEKTRFPRNQQGGGLLVNVVVYFDTKVKLEKPTVTTKKQTEEKTAATEKQTGVTTKKEVEVKAETKPEPVAATKVVKKKATKTTK